MERQNCCKDCADRTDGCHSKCADYAALKAEFAAKREYLKLNRNPADEVLAAGYKKRKRKAMRKKRR